MNSKVCFKCGAEKPLSEYYKHKRMADGHVNKCKECNKKDVRENRKDKLEYYLEFDRNRPNHEERVAKQSELRKLAYLTCPIVREAAMDRQRATRKNQPLKYKARCCLSNAVRDGKVDKPVNCEHCASSDKKIQGHHWSYLEEHWLDVIWLCTGCHGKEHKRLNALGRDPDLT